MPRRGPIRQAARWMAWRAPRRSLGRQPGRARWCRRAARARHRTRAGVHDAGPRRRRPGSPQALQLPERRMPERAPQDRCLSWERQPAQRRGYSLRALRQKALPQKALPQKTLRQQARQRKARRQRRATARHRAFAAGPDAAIPRSRELRTLQQTQHPRAQRQERPRRPERPQPSMRAQRRQQRDQMRPRRQAPGHPPSRRHPLAASHHHRQRGADPVAASARPRFATSSALRARRRPAARR